MKQIDLIINIKEMVRFAGNEILNVEVSLEEMEERIDETVLIALTEAEHYCNRADNPLDKHINRRRFLHWNLNMEKNENGDCVINFDEPLVTISGRTYNSLEDYLTEVSSIIFDTFVTLTKESEELNDELNNVQPSLPDLDDGPVLDHEKGLGSDVVRHRPSSNISKLHGTLQAALRKELKGKKMAKVIYANPAPKKRYVWEPINIPEIKNPQTSTYVARGPHPEMLASKKAGKSQSTSVNHVKLPINQNNKNDKFDVATLKPSKELQQYMRDSEGLPGSHGKPALKPYYDKIGNKTTIGYGKVLHSGKPTAADKKKYKDKPYTAKRAEDDFQAGIEKQGVEPVQRDVKVPLTQNQFDALVDYSYNSGMGRFYNSNLLKAINSNDPKRTTPQAIDIDFHQWDRVPWRKEDEANIFNYGFDSDNNPKTK